MALRPDCQRADSPLSVSDTPDHLCAPESAFSKTAIPPCAVHHGCNEFAGNARSLGDAQTIDIGTLALDNDVGFAFAKSAQSRVLFRDWVVGSVLARRGPGNGYLSVSNRHWTYPVSPGFIERTRR